MQWVMSLQKFLAVNRKLISNSFLALEVVVVGLWAIVYFQAVDNFRSIFIFAYDTGILFGQSAVIFYTITLLPGIITRLQWFRNVTQPIASIILPFRRHFGILMFLSVFIHLSFTTAFPYWVRHDFNPPGILPELALFQWMGLFAWLSLLPLWLTSNDFAQKSLGKFWKMLHRLTYVALFFIFLHVALQKTIWMYVVGPFLVLEILSWIVFWRREASAPKIVTTPVTQPAATPPQQPVTPQV